MQIAKVRVSPSGQNLYVKIPAAEPGLDGVEATIAAGATVNVAVDTGCAMPATRLSTPACRRSVCKSRSQQPVGDQRWRGHEDQVEQSS
jgi:hypothetical protein